MLESSWKSERSFNVTVLVRRPVEQVREALADPHRWVRFQPLVVDLIEEPGAAGRFRVIDRFRFAGVPFRHSYRASIQPHAEGIDSEAWSTPFIHLRNRIRWVAEGPGTRLSEHVRAVGPRPLMSFVERTAHRAHQTMLEGIRDALERSDAAAAG